MRGHLYIGLNYGLSVFPFLFGGTFIEGSVQSLPLVVLVTFPFLFGGTFIEGLSVTAENGGGENFPSFSEGLSLRGIWAGVLGNRKGWISLPFRRDFH